MKQDIQVSAAKNLSKQQKIKLAIKSIEAKSNITKLSLENNVSRKFLHQQKNKALNAVYKAFKEKDEAKPLFLLPVTKQWIRQFSISLILLCHSSYRGVSEVLTDVFDYPIAHTTIHNIVHENISLAKECNSRECLNTIRHGAHDEIYQAGKPVLAAIDLDSTYCYLLSAEDHCDETTWGYHLLNLADKGLELEYTVADGGRGLRAGQSAALEDTPCFGDVFHAERELGKLVFFLKNRAKGCTGTREKIEHKMKKAKKKAKGQSFSKKLGAVKKEENIFVPLAKDIQEIANWMQNDILSIAGPNLTERRKLFDFVVEELKKREHHCPHRIQPVRKSLENQRDNLLAFVELLDGKLEYISARFDVPCHIIHKICELQNLSKRSVVYWEKRDALHKKLHDKYYEIESLVNDEMSTVHRASSMVENLNSRLRNYFFLRRHVGDNYLELLRFFLNHHKYLRSDCPERVGKSPAELLTGEDHPHWLEMLGYERFKRKAS